MNGQSSTTTRTTSARAVEQGHVDRAYELLEARVERHSRPTALCADSKANAAHQQEKLEQAALERDLLNCAQTALAYGRLTMEDDDSFLVGAVNIDDQYDDFVLSWKADAAQPFYQASHQDPMGVDLRRKFSMDGRTVKRVADEAFSKAEGSAGVTPLESPASSEQQAWAAGDDPLLSALGQGRGAQMRQIAATIQAEQDRLIRFDDGRALVIQGGPGTGKTAVGLHRLSWMLYQRRNDGLAAEDVLVVGPNTVFLRYIAGVLPSLGDGPVRQAVVDDLTPFVSVDRIDSAKARRVKHSAAMAAVLSRSIEARIRRPATDLVIAKRIRLQADEIGPLLQSLADPKTPYNDRRKEFVAQARRAFQVKIGTSWVRATDRRRGLAVRETIDAHKSQIESVLGRLWPTLSERQVVIDLLTKPSRLKAASQGLLGKAEQADIQLAGVARLDDMTWSAEDRLLLDEAKALLAGVKAADLHRHILIDEAQDLSPMQLRAIGRRIGSGQVTMVGDLAQAQTPWASRTWEDATGHLGRPQAAVETLTTGYRVTAEVMALANGVLARMTTDVPPTRSVRTGGTDPEIVGALWGTLLAEVCRRVALPSEGTLGVICGDEYVWQVEREFAGSGVAYHMAEQDLPDSGVVVVPASLARGLEFDDVILVEPAAIVDQADGDLGLLYVGLTRSVGRLTVVHERPLPWGDEPEPVALQPVEHGLPGADRRPESPRVLHHRSVSGRNWQVELLDGPGSGVVSLETVADGSDGSAVTATGFLARSAEKASVAILNQAGEPVSMTVALDDGDPNRDLAELIVRLYIG